MEAHSTFAAETRLNAADVRDETPENSGSVEAGENTGPDFKGYLHEDLKFHSFLGN